MLQVTRAAVARWVETLLHIHDTPRRIAAAYALGVFFGFSPLLGLHTILALACALRLRLNRLAVLAGVYSNVPWIIAAYYTLATMFGAALLGEAPPAGFRSGFDHLFALSIFGAAFWETLMDLLQPLFWPYVIGSTIGAIVLALAAYSLLFAVLEARHRRRHGHG